MPRFEDEEGCFWDDEEEEDENEDDDEEYEEEESELEELIDLSQEMVETGESMEAIRLWKRSIDRFSDEPRAFVSQARSYLGFLNEQLGDESLEKDDEELQPIFKRAIFAAEEALSTDSDMYGAWNILGDLHWISRDVPAALNAWNKSLEINPDQNAIEAKRDIAEEEAAR